MIVSACQHAEYKKHGKDCNGNQRYRCKLCGETWIEAGPRPLGDMRIDMADAVLALRLLVEGNSVRTTSRITGLAKDTILDLLVMVGDRARQFWNDRMKGIACQTIQLDEVWGFIGCKEKHRVRKGLSEELGDCYVFTAIDPCTKLLVNWHAGKRSPEDCQWFCHKLARSTVGRMQSTTDGYKPYISCILETFGNRVDFAQLVKIFGPAKGPDGGTYSPSVIKGTRRRFISGDPDGELVSTSMVERSNKTWRMRCRRMTRLTDGHSKKWQNHEAALALTFVVYNFVTIHGTLKTTPAVEHGLTDHPWTMEELLGELAHHA